jgi:hypothetical protein
MTASEGLREFSVYQSLTDDSCERICEHVGAREAVTTARSYTLRPAAQIGIIRRIIITDADDCTVFEWKFGEGIVFPTPEMRAEARAQQ